MKDQTANDGRMNNEQTALEENSSGVSSGQNTEQKKKEGPGRPVKKAVTEGAEITYKAAPDRPRRVAPERRAAPASFSTKPDSSGEEPLSPALLERARKEAPVSSTLGASPRMSELLDPSTREQAQKKLDEVHDPAFRLSRQRFQGHTLGEDQPDLPADQTEAEKAAEKAGSTRESVSDETAARKENRKENKKENSQRAEEDREAESLSRQERQKQGMSEEDDEVPYRSLSSDEKKERHHAFWSRIGKRFVRVVLSWPFVCILVVLGFLGWLMYSMLQLGLLKASVGALVIGITLAGLALAGYWFFETRSHIWRVPAVILCIGMCICAVMGEQFVSSISNGILSIASDNSEYTSSGGIYVPADIPLASVQALESQTIGIVNGRNEELNQTVFDELHKQGINFKTRSFDSLGQLYRAVRGQSVRAAVLSSADIRVLRETSGDTQANAGLEDGAVWINRSTGVRSTPAEINVDEDPFTVLISASRQTLSQSSYSSTLNLLLTVNPKTNDVLVTVIPRALAVPSACDPSFGCPADQATDRLGLFSLRQMPALAQVVENEFGVKVDFLCQVDETSLSQLYDLIPGLYDGADMHFLLPETIGQIDEKTISGPKVMQIIGTFGSFSGSDFDQELNQLVMLDELARAGSGVNSSNVIEVFRILDESLSTTFDASQLTALIRRYAILPEPVNVYYSTISGDWQPIYSPILTETTYMLVPHPDSLEKAKAAIQAVLNGQKPETDGIAQGTYNPAAPAEAAPEEEQASSERSEQSEQADSDAEQPAEEEQTDPYADPYGGMYYNPYYDPYYGYYGDYGDYGGDYGDTGAEEMPDAEAYE